MQCPRCNVHELEEMILDEEGAKAGGIEPGNYGVCHKCKSLFTKTEVWSRVVGYLRPVDGWNKGKKEEFGQRKEYVIKPGVGPQEENK